MINQHNLSPEKYVRTRVRTLPISECYMNKNWQEFGMAQIYVARKHKSGNVTLGIYLVDTFALGVKDTFFRFNLSELEFSNLIKTTKSKYTDDDIDNFGEADYVTVHNVIFGSIAFAEEHGFKPHKDFATTKFILEDDDENIELIEYEFGKDGKPFLIL